MILTKTFRTIIVLSILIYTGCGELSNNSTTNAILNNYYCNSIEDNLYYPTMTSINLSNNFNDFQKTNFTNYCLNQIVQDDIAGNPKKSISAWKKSYGSALMIAAIDQTRKPMPYVKDILYKRTGDCQLGIRIYMQDPQNKKNKKLKPLLFFHGGSWMYRALTSTIAIDAVVPNLTAKDYVVFSPMYRLINDRSGPPECRNVTGKEILKDAEDALQWIINNKHNFFSTNAQEKITVGGHSSGGHLAAYLATHKPELIKKAFLFYPVTDFSFVLKNINEGGLYYDNFDFSKRALFTFLDINSTKDPRLTKRQKIISDNSFPEIINKSPHLYPPMFFLHGTEDSHAPPEFSSRMCEALNPKESPSEDLVPKRTIIKKCDERGSTLALIDRADHMLDLKCFSKFFADIFPLDLYQNKICPSKDYETEEIIEKTLEDLYNNFL